MRRRRGREGGKYKKVLLEREKRGSGINLSKEAEKLTMINNINMGCSREAPPGRLTTQC